MKVNSKAFAEETNISKKTATRILSIIYDKGLDATSFDRVMYRTKNFIIKTKIPEMIDKLNDGQITNLIDEMIAEDEKYRTRNDESSSVLQASENIGLWLFSEFAESEKEYSAGDMVTIQIMRVGKWNHPQYGTIEINKKTLSEVKQNFDKNVRQIELAVDENHEPNHKALAWYRELELQDSGQALFATLELTKKGAELLNEGAYKYFSPEIVFKKQDEESGKVVTNLLIGGAFTNRPFFKAMKPLLASEDCSDEAANAHQRESDNQYTSNLLIFNDSKSMKTILELLAKFSEQETISASEKTQLEQCFSSLADEDKTDELTSAFNEVVAKFSDESSEEEGDEEDKTTETEDKSEDASEDESEDSDEDGASIQANEEVVSIKASELAKLKNLASETSKLVAEKRKGLAADKVKSLAFSESNKQGIVLPKSQQAIVDFAISLSEKQEQKFFSILESLSKVAAEEVGHGETTTTSEFSSKDESKIAYFKEKLGLSDEEAKLALNEFKEVQ